MKRRLTAILMFILIGFTLNVFVAALMPLLPFPIDLTYYYGDDALMIWREVKPDAVTEQPPIQHFCLRHDRFGYRNDRLQLGNTQTQKIVAQLHRVRSGWPLSAFTGIFDQTGPTPTRCWLFEPPSHLGPITIQQPAWRSIPMKPAWPGLPVNTAFYALIALAFWLVAKERHVIRAALRRRRGACPNCAYDLRGTTHDACPECGCAIVT